MHPEKDLNTGPKATLQSAESTSATSVVELPPVSHMSALQFIEEALQLHLDELQHSEAEGEAMILKEMLKLIQSIHEGAGNDVLGARVDALHETVDGLVKASNDLVEGAQAQVLEYADEFKKQAEGCSTQAKCKHVTISVISDEISRRMVAVEESSHIQEELEDQRAELTQEIENIEEIIRHSDDTGVKEQQKTKIELVRQMQKLDARIKTLLQARDVNEQTIGKLKRYDEAMKILKKGLEPEIFGEDVK